MMGIEKLIEQLKYYGTTYAIGDNLGKEIDGSDELMLDAATALSTLQAENEKLRDELKQAKAERDAAIDADKAILWLKDYVFEDSRKIYTNGARIIPYFRVLQALRDKAYNGLKEGI